MSPTYRSAIDDRQIKVHREGAIDTAFGSPGIYER
jgi:hypothetical protein